MDAICKGSDKASGVMPGAGKRGKEEWAHWNRGELRCVFCGQYLKHGPTGRLPEHTARTVATP